MRPSPPTCLCGFALACVSASLPLLLTSSCAEPQPDRLPDELVVLTRNAPTTYFLDRDSQPTGPEYEMATAFAAYIGRPVRFEVLDSVGAILDALESGRGNLAAAGLTLTPQREARFLVGPYYQEVEEQLVCHPDVGVREAADLSGLRLAVVDRSSYQETLEALRENLKALAWESVSDRSTEQLLYEVGEHTIDCTVADSNIVAIHRRYLPRIESALVVGTEKKLVWMLPPGEAALADRLAQWMASYRATGELARVQNRYYGHLDQFDPYDVAVFTRRVEDRLPRFKPLFEEASQASSLPWTMLAAMSYQESQWDPAATSATGVRGIMMLTRVTAGALGVSNRLDPMESILAGVEYLRQRMDLIPSYVPHPDRLWMGLAAYNVGQSHLRDARMLAVRLGENPNTWAGVKATLPRLAQRRYYQSLPAGYARGLEPVIYVERVRHYQDILEALLTTRDILE